MDYVPDEDVSFSSDEDDDEEEDEDDAMPVSRRGQTKEEPQDIEV